MEWEEAQASGREKGREGVRGKEERRAEDRKGGGKDGRERGGKHGGREKLMGDGGERWKAVLQCAGRGWVEAVLVETLPVQGAEVTYPIASHP